jgi:outer membrane lipoprotein-sorting protein
MKKFAIIGLVLAAGIAAAVAMGAQEKALDFKGMLAKIDNMGDFGKDDFSCVYEIASVKPGEKPSLIKAQVYIRDYKDQFVYILLSPEEDKGKGFLQDGDNMWTYDPAQRLFTKTSFKEQVSDSNAKSGDLKGLKYSEDYDIVSTTEGMIEKYPVWNIELKAKTDDTMYPKEILSVRKDNQLLLKVVSYGADGKKPLRTTYITKYVKVGSRIIPSAQKIVDEVKVGEQSTVVLSSPSTAKLPDYYFTKAFLEGQSR